MIVSRGTKTIRLSPEVRAMLGIAAETVDSDQLIQAVLRMPTDLLFNGGIGTYVKAQSETNAEVGDSINAAVRVNADRAPRPRRRRGRQPRLHATRRASSSRSPAAASTPTPSTTRRASTRPTTR